MREEIQEQKYPLNKRPRYALPLSHLQLQVPQRSFRKQESAKPKQPQQGVQCHCGWLKAAQAETVNLKGTASANLQQKNLKPAQSLILPPKLQYLYYITINRLPTLD